MKKLFVELVCVLLVFAGGAYAQQLTADAEQDFEIKWHHETDWIKVTATDITFTTGAVGEHEPFADFGVNLYEADITGVYSGCEFTKMQFRLDIQAPAEIQGNPRWLRCDIHFRLRLAVSRRTDVSPWSVVQDKNFFRLPRSFPAPIRISLPG